MSSVDGRLIGERWSRPFDGTEQDELYKVYDEISEKLGPKVWMVGRNTIQQDFKVSIFDYKKYRPGKEFISFVGKRETKDSCVVFDSKGQIYYPDEKLNGDNIIAVLGESVSDEYLSHLRERGISYLFAGKDGYDLNKALGILNSDFGYNELLLDGGGHLNGVFLKTGLIDELSLLMYPGIDGLSGIPSIFEYKGIDGELPANGQTLELLAVEKLKHGIVWMQYKFHKK